MILLLLLCFLVTSGLNVYGLPYDYSFTNECLESPLKPQYGGGIVVNPEMNEGLKGWSTLFSGNGKLEVRKYNKDGNSFMVYFVRDHASNHTLSQTFDLKKRIFYTISAWLRLSDGESHVLAVFNTSTGIQHVGSTIVRSGCWSMLKGGLVSETSGPAQLSFELSDQSATELWADSISVQPFTEDEWISHQTESTNKVRKREVVFKAVDSQGQPLANATVSIKQLRANFPFGTAVSSYILKSQAYQNWFFSRVKYTVFENEMKWICTEYNRGYEDYSAPDAMIKLMQQHNVQVRGHNILWDEPDRNPPWVQSLTGPQLSQAVDKRLYTIVRRYKDQVIHWDVVNENMHTSFLEDNLHDPAASAKYYLQVNEIDRNPIPFLNEYFTIENPGDLKASPVQYVHKINQMEIQGYKGPLGIGLQGHFKNINLAYVRSGLDVLASKKLPIWITELTVEGSNLGQSMDQITRELISHPSIEGIIMWAAISPTGCAVMCLTDQNFKNLPTGDAIDRIRQELTHGGLTGVTDADGFFKASLFHGEYDFHFRHPDAVNNSSSYIRGFKVAQKKTEGNNKIVSVMLHTVS